MTALRAALLATSMIAAGPSSAQAPAGAAPPQPPASAAPPQAGAVPSSAAAPTPASSPPRAPEPVNRFGLGAGIGTADTAPVLYLPFDVGPVRIEPNGAYAKFGTSELSSSASRIGLGIFGLVPVGPGIRCPVGGRVEYARDEVTGSSTEAVRFAAAVGAEWGPVPSVSFGVEAQVGYTAGLGDRASGADVSAQAILRVFLASWRSSGSGGAPGAPQEARPTRPKKCQRSSDCERPDICFDGYCRH